MCAFIPLSIDNIGILFLFLAALTPAPPLLFCSIVQTITFLLSIPMLNEGISVAKCASVAITLVGVVMIALGGSTSDDGGDESSEW